MVAVGEGPTSFTDYFSQQERWSRGTDEVLLRRFWRMAHRLRPRAFVHYLLLTSYYPTAAIAWMLGSVNAILYFSLGAGGVVVPAHIWLMLYVDAAALQVGLYFYNRRHNVSPHEKKGSAGVSGMLISALSAPIYAASLAAVLLGRSSGFVTTPKGDASTQDSLVTFRKHMLWALAFGLPLALSFATATGTPRCAAGRWRRWPSAWRRSPSGASSWPGGGARSPPRRSSPSGAGSRRPSARPRTARARPAGAGAPARGSGRAGAAQARRRRAAPIRTVASATRSCASTGAARPRSSRSTWSRCVSSGPAARREHVIVHFEPKRHRAGDPDWEVLNEVEA